ncbi:MAG: peptidoglycan editing factor PgeF [Ignavibacteriaceae bacterium]
MFIIKPYIFQRFPEIIFGFSTKIGGNPSSVFGFNLSFSVGDEREIVESNRKTFFNAIGLEVETVGYQRQIHSDTIKIINCSGDNGQSDALITSKNNLGLAISAADCTPIFIYDRKNKVIAGVHSGWRGTKQKILYKTLLELAGNFNSKAENLFVYIGPSISAVNYEVGQDVAEKFDKKYVMANDKKLFLDVSGNNYDMLLGFGIPQNQIQKSTLCTYEYASLLHSYRRDREQSGRSMGVIALKA